MKKKAKTVPTPLAQSGKAWARGDFWRQTMKKKQRRYPEFTAEFKPRYPFGLLSIPYRLCGKPLTRQERRHWERKGA